MKFALFAIAFTAVEALRLRTAVKADPEHEMVQAIIDELDADNSGDISLNELLSYAKKELNSACKEYQVPQTSCDAYWEEGKKFLTQMFNDADTDGSGAVDRKELDAAIKGN